MPIISVIIPAYNAEKTITATIKSVQQQTFTDWELIVVNDGSCDKTLEIVQSINDERIKIFDYENGGSSVARNRGIERAVGDFIAFLDADDLWTEDKLELQLKALQSNPEAGVAYSWTHFINEQGELLYPHKPLFYEGNVYPDLLLSNFLANGSNPLIRKQAIACVGEFDASLYCCEDWEYYLRLAACYQFVVVSKYQILYRQSSKSMSSQVENIKKGGLKVLEKAFSNAPAEIKYMKNKSLSLFLQFCSEISLRNSRDISQVKQAGKYLLSSLYIYPKLLLSISTQKLIVKYFVKRLLPDNINEKIIYFLRKKPSMT